MTQSLETIRRIHAWHAGKPLQRGEVINVHVADDNDIFIMAFLRMGGESRPWGIAYGTASEQPHVVTVPEGRNRDLVGDMVIACAPALLEFFRHPEFSDDGPAVSTSQPLRQLWVPGQSHVEMLHYLAAAYARTQWPRADVDTLRAIGNLANCLFIEGQRPGQQTLISATEALQRAFIFPTAPVRQGHLGHLLAWLRGGNTRDSRQRAAQEAEKLSVATVLSPDIERNLVQPHLARWNDAKKNNDAHALKTEEEELHHVLESELLRRWQITKESIDILRNDSRQPNMGLNQLCEDSRRSFYSGWGERAMNEAAGAEVYWPNVFTDYSPRSAGYAYQMRITDDLKARSALIHGDRELQQEELAKGHGFICTISTVDPEEPFWTALWTYPDTPPTCKPGDSLVIAGAAPCEVEILDIDEDTHTLELRPKWKRDKKELGTLGRAPTHSLWVGRPLVLLDAMPHSLGFAKAKNTLRANENGVDITDFIIARPRRHGAFDDDGQVVVSQEQQ